MVPNKALIGKRMSLNTTACSIQQFWGIPGNLTGSDAAIA